MLESAPMRSFFLSLLLLFAPPETAFAQDRPAGEFAAGYQHVFARGSSETTQFPGWSVSGGAYVTDSLAIVGMVTGGYRSDTLTSSYTERGNFGTTVYRYETFDVASSVYQFMGGVHEAYLRDNTVSPFVRALIGMERSAVGVSGVAVSESAFVMSPGAGVDIRVTPQTAVRVAGDYRYGFYEGGGTNDIVLTVGLVVGVGSR